MPYGIPPRKLKINTELPRLLARVKIESYNFLLRSSDDGGCWPSHIALPKLMLGAFYAQDVKEATPPPLHVAAFPVLPTPC
jgi:hypothetical protein